MPTMPADQDKAKAQIARFKSAARALDCDEDKDRFEAQLGKIVAHKPAKDEHPPKTKKAKKPSSR